MDKNNIVIRLERKDEYRKVEELVKESFWNVYRPGCFEHYLLHILRDDPSFVKELDFVMELDGQIIGQNVFYKTQLDCDDGKKVEILMMGPICIRNDLKRKGYGKILLDFCLSKAKELGYKAVCLEGNYDFYSKCGLTYASDFGIRYHGIAEGEDQSFFLAMELEKGYLDGVTAEFSTPSIYLVDEDEVEKFDSTFPYMEKLKLPGQLF